MTESSTPTPTDGKFKADVSPEEIEKLREQLNRTKEKDELLLQMIQTQKRLDGTDIPDDALTGLTQFAEDLGLINIKEIKRVTDLIGLIMLLLMERYKSSKHPNSLKDFFWLTLDLLAIHEKTVV